MRSNRIRPTTIIALTFLLLYLFRRLRFVIRRASALKLFGKVSMAGNQSNHNGMSRVRQRLCQDGAGDYAAIFPRVFFPVQSAACGSLTNVHHFRHLHIQHPVPAGNGLSTKSLRTCTLIMREEGDLSPAIRSLRSDHRSFIPALRWTCHRFFPAKSLLLLSGKVTGEGGPADRCRSP